MFGDVVLGMKPERKEDRDPFEVILEREEAARAACEFDADLPVEALRELVARVQGGDPAAQGGRVPRGAVRAAPGRRSGRCSAPGTTTAPSPTGSSTASRPEWGTAVTVQSMVFGNMGDDSGTGVAFTRNPATGEDEFYGEFLVNAQGEDVVAGIRTPQKIGELAARSWPEIARQLEDVAREARAPLPRHAGHRVHHRARASSTCCRRAAGSAPASPRVRIAVEMAERAAHHAARRRSLRVEPEALNHLLRPIFDADAEGRRGEGGPPPREGAAGRARAPRAAGSSSSREDAAAWRARGEAVILARHETSPEDIRGMAAAEGFLTAFGGMTSHAALVARQMGKVAIVGCERALVRLPRAHDDGGDAPTAERVLREGDCDLDRRPRRRGDRGTLETRPSEVVAGARGEEPRPRRRARLPASSRSSSAGRTRRGGSRCAPTPTSPTRRRWRSPSARRASACAAPSTCSSARGRSARCAR